MSQMSDPDKYMQETGVPPAPQTPHQPDSHSAKPCEAGAPERPRPAHISYIEQQCSTGSALPTARLIMLGIVAAAAVLPRVDTRDAMAVDAPLVRWRMTWKGQEITENQGRRRPGTADERAHTHILSLSTYSSYTGLVSLYP